jgi:glycosyltransferase involved in cell wall biosynthesis
MLRGCLATVRAELGPDDELLVIDSCSVHEGTAAVAVEHQARCIRASVKGASVARNVGWRVAAHDRICFVDDDVRVLRGWADAMAAALALPGVGFVTGRVGSPPGQEDVARKVAQIEQDEPMAIDRSSTRMIGHSANLGAHRAALALVGGFDERLGPGHPFVAEDYDLFDRLVLAGVLGRYEPAARAWHEQWRGKGERLRLDWNYGLGAGARLAKLVRLDRRRALAVGRHVLAEWVLEGIKGDLRSRSKLGPAHAAVLLAGVGGGFAATIGVRVRAGHLEARRALPDVSSSP